MEDSIGSPGTVSKILWHFTGGPGWNESKRCQNKSPKPAAEAYANLKSILKSRELRLGRYKELIRVRLPDRRKLNESTGEFETVENVQEELESSPVCCLADIPIVHLGYLARRYGKFAVGFHRASVVRHGFNPVFYTLDDAESALSIYKGLGQLGNLNGEVFSILADLTRQSVEKFVGEHNLSKGPNLRVLNNIPQQAGLLNETLDNARKSLENFLGLVKTFSPEEFGSIYCEREWRSLEQLNFSSDDIAMVVLPRRVGKNEYFRRFCEEVKDEPEFPFTVPIEPWEDLVEH